MIKKLRNIDMNIELQKLATRKIALLSVFVIGSIVIFNSCKGESEPLMPEIYLEVVSDYTHDGDTVAVGGSLTFRIVAEGPEANITNFTVKKEYQGTVKTVMDSGLNSAGFTLDKTFYQSVEDDAVWIFAVQDRNKNTAETSLRIFKDPNSSFGGIIEYPSITLGYQQNTDMPHFFLPATGDLYEQDSASMFQGLVDVLVYYYESEDNGVLLPSPTFSSPGEDASAVGYLYEEHYPYLVDWETQNYTKWDIRADNGVTSEDFENAHNDSLLIVSYDDVWGKKKYKWATDGIIIPFMTADGKKGIVKVLDAEHAEDGQISFAMKIQM